jgi:nucleoside-diphosphate-sugar epimerase
MAKLMVTGAAGFIGTVLCGTLKDRGMEFLPVIRRRITSFSDALIFNDIGASTEWKTHLRGVNIVVHLAARVHVLNDRSTNRLQDYRFANVDATLNLARQCAAAGVKRFIYLSSIKVNGEETTGRPFAAVDRPHPADPYGISKLEAEQGLKVIASQTGLEVVIIRPPLVYGPNVSANFMQLMQWIKRGFPLPFASLDNQRDVVYVGNLVDLIIRCASSSTAAGHTFLVSDGRSVSTEELIREIALAMNRKPFLLSVPKPALMFFARLLGKEMMAKRLLGSLQVNMEATMETLDWVPPYSLEYGIAKTVQHFLETE